jgi:hypothetical protein
LNTTTRLYIHHIQFKFVVSTAMFHIIHHTDHYNNGVWPMFETDHSNSYFDDGLYCTDTIGGSSLNFLVHLKKTKPDEYTEALRNMQSRTMSKPSFAGLSQDSIRVCADCWQVMVAERDSKPKNCCKEINCGDEGDNDDEDDEDDDDDDDEYEDEDEDDEDEDKDMVNRDAVAACRCGLSSDCFAESSLFDEALTAELTRTGYDDIVFDENLSVFSETFNVAKWHEYGTKKDGAKIASALAVGYAPKFAANLETEDPETKRKLMRRETNRIDYMRGIHKFEQVYHDMLTVLHDIPQLEHSPK